MIELSPEISTIVILGGILVGGIMGIHLGVVLGAILLIVGSLTLGPGITIDMLYMRSSALIESYSLAAIPLFIFMGSMLGYSGIAEKLYNALYLWLGGFRGGLAIATVLIGTVMAACVGSIGATVPMLTIMALPSMLKRGYDKALAVGTCSAGGCLGVLIPPSILLVIYGPMAQISVGKLFMGAFFPGFLLATLYCTYIALRCFFQPKAGPGVPSGESRVPFAKKTGMLLLSLVPPGLLILSVLGVIFLGIAPPTEAAAVGALAATLLTIAYRKFSWGVLRKVSLETIRVAGYVFFIGAMAFSLVGVFLSLGCGEVVKQFIMSAPFGRWGAFAATMLIVFLLGFFVDVIGIFLIIVPIISPIAPALGFDPIWFGIMININIQMSFNTPPFAPAIFIVRGIIRPEQGISFGDIIRGVIPFIVLVMVGIGICVAFPEIILWLPSMMIK